MLLDLDVLDRNIAAMATHAKQAGVQLRPHSRGGKSVAIAQRQVAAGAIGICCATIGEAEAIAGAGIENVLITSPIVTPPMIDRLIALNGRATGLIIVADNPANVDALAAACANPGQNLSVLVDFDVGHPRPHRQRSPDQPARRVPALDLGCSPLISEGRGTTPRTMHPIANKSQDHICRMNSRERGGG